ncbi:MAG: hypothetical protein QNJ41_05555 [Xenococcaceae cyanobacterium MO_188.B32]|nr:hypothetical protein [Xenococcaceae cyanobacterium MO_188.B32]
MKWYSFKALGAVKNIGIFFLSMLTFCFFNVDAALAHGPHDVVIEVELSPDYDRDQTAYYLLDSYLPVWGNLFKSEDGGDSWKKIENGLDNRHELVSLAVSSQSKQILFISSLGDGIYKSQDEGASWVKVNRGLETLSIDLVAISPHFSDLVFAAGTDHELYKTENGGASWNQIMTGESKITAIAFAPEQQEQIIVGDEGGNIYFSVDLGERWQRIATLKNSGVIQAIAISPNYATDRTVWVGTVFAGTAEGLFITQDGGASWHKLPGTAYGGDNYIETIALSPNYQSGQAKPGSEADRTLLVSVRGQGLFKTKIFNCFNSCYMLLFTFRLFETGKKIALQEMEA